MSRRANSLLNSFLLNAAFWLGWLALQMFLLIHSGQDWRNSAIDSTISVTLLCTFSFRTIIQFRYYRSGVWTRIYRLGFGVGVAIAFVVASKYVIKNIIPDPSYENFLEETTLLRFVLGFLLIALAV